MDLTSEETKTLESYLRATEKEARSWWWARWLMVIGGVFNLALGGYTMKLGQTTYTQMATWGQEDVMGPETRPTTTPATSPTDKVWKELCQLDRRVWDDEMRAMLLPAVILLFGGGVFIAVKGGELFVIALVRWNKHKRNLLAVKLARMFLAEKGILPPQ